MRQPAASILPLLVLACLQLGAVELPTEIQIREWIQHLNSTNVEPRNTARRQLLDAGRLAIPPLLQSARSDQDTREPSLDLLSELTLSNDLETGRTATATLGSLVKSTDPELAAAAWRARRKATDRRAAALRSLGAQVFLEEHEIREAKLDRLAIRETDLIWLRDQPELTDLSFEETSIVNLNTMGALPKLEWLNLYRTSLNDEALLHFRQFPMLEHVSLGETRVTDAGLAHIKKLPRLQYLGLKGNEVSDAGLPHLASLTNLTGLNLGNTRISDTGLAQLQSLDKLEQLWVDHTKLTDRAVDFLGSLRSLQRLHLSGTQITDAGFSRLRSALPKCAIER